MTNDELAQLELLSRTAPDQIDAFLDPIAQRHHRLAGASGEVAAGSPVYLMIQSVNPEVWVDELPHKRVWSGEVAPAVGELLALAGLKERVKELRERLQRGLLAFEPGPAPGDPGISVAWPEPDRHDLVTSDITDAMEKTATPKSLLKQTCACLHLLASSPFQHIPVLGWVRRIVQERLSQLLLAQPALLHRRLFYDIHSGERMREEVPLAHALAMHTHAGLPSRLQGYTDAQLHSFAHHPIVANAITKPAPLAAPRKMRAGQGRTLLGMFGEAGNPHRLRRAMLTSVLQLERIRKAARPRCASAIPKHDDFVPEAAEVFSNAWRNGERDRSLHLFSELRSSSLMGDAFRFRALMFASRAIVDDKRDAKGLNTLTQVDDIPRRLERLTYALRLAGVVGAHSEGAAASMVAQSLFALPDDDVAPFLSTSASGVNVQGAAQAIAFFESKGIPLEELTKRISASGATAAGSDPNDPWATALRIAATERSMTRVIQESAATALPSAPASSGPSDEPAPRRRRRLSM